MEIKEFENSRNSKLEEFQKTYDALKRDYSSTTMAAIQEKDPAKQQELISKVLSINSELSTELRNIIADIYKGSDSVPTKTMDELTADLINYQKEYVEIEKGKDKLQTLKLINKANESKLADTSVMFNIYIGVLIFLILIVGYLVLRTNWRAAYNSITSAITPTSMLPQT
jgi:hypothetical protein